MKLLLERLQKATTYTHGKLSVDGTYCCETIEDCCRGLSSNMSEEEIKSKKIYGQTAIPTGIYKIDMNTVSPKFKDRSWAKPYGGKLPRLLNVPGYEGILIHVGNTVEDTSGCILVGTEYSDGFLRNSATAFTSLMSVLTNTKEPIIITIQ